MPTQVFVVGELAVVAFGAEIFTETSLEIGAARVGRPTLVVGYATADVGYLPPEGEHRFAGYEVERAYRYYGYPDVFAPQAEALARRAALEMVRRKGG